MEVRVFNNGVLVRLYNTITMSKAKRIAYYYENKPQYFVQIIERNLKNY